VQKGIQHYCVLVSLHKPQGGSGQPKTREEQWPSGTRCPNTLYRTHQAPNPKPLICPRCCF